MDVAGILDRVVSHALASGLFERVNQHEPKAAPGTQLMAAVWVDRMEPLRGGSGLDATSVRLGLITRLYTSMLAEPQDAIDPNLLTAADTLMRAYSGDFTLGGAVRNVDLLGRWGPGLSAQAGYVDQDNRLYRVISIALPLIVNDVWDQEE